MPIATVDGIDTYYETYGSGSPILMCAPGGFDATIDKWRQASAWTGIDAIKVLAAEHTVVVYDRRECGRSAGRIERLGWASLARHGKALLDHLDIGAAWIMGGCMGCSVALAFGVHHPEATRGLLLHWPVGGFRWKANSQERFLRHYNFAKQNGIKGVIERARGGKSFWMDPEGGPWATMNRAGRGLCGTLRRARFGALSGNCHHYRPRPVRPRHSARRRAGRGYGSQGAVADHSGRRCVSCDFGSALSPRAAAEGGVLECHAARANNPRGLRSNFRILPEAFLTNSRR